MEPSLHFYDPSRATRTNTSRLPHLDQPEAAYFLTFRLADAIPADALRAYLREREDWLGTHPPRPWPPELEKEFHRKFTGRFERWLDRGYGTCLLRDPADAGIVADTLKHFDGERYRLHAWVVMPNHVHVLASLMAGQKLADVLRSWKGFSSRQIHLRRGDSGTLWQKSYFDRIVRDEEHFAKCARYIRNNPAKAGLARGDYLLGESDLVRRIQ
jgi:REP element-mobilizing transposase RayT